MPLISGKNSLIWSTGIDNNGLEQDSKKSVGIIGKLAKNVTKADVFAGLAVSGALAFAKLSKDAFEFSRNFETAMLEVKTISSAAQDDFLGFQQSVIDLSKQVPQSASELAEALYQLVSAGFDGAAGLKLLQTSAKAAVGGVTSVKVAADGLTTVLNAWKINAKDVDKVSDAMFKTVEKGKTTFSELADNISTVAPLAASMNISLEEVLGALATLTKQGIPTAQAVTQIRSSIISMSEVLGDGWSDAMTYQEAVGEIARQAGGSSTKLREMTGRVEAMSAILGLTGQNAKEAANDLKLIQDSAGAAGNAFTDMVTSNVNQFKILGNNINSKLKPLGDALLKLSSDAAGAINKLFRDTGSGVESIVGKMQMEMVKVSSLFEILKNAEKGTREYSSAIEQVNKNFGEYLPNLVTVESTLIDIEKAQRDVTQAMLANIAVQQVQVKINDKLGEFATDLQSTFDKIVSKLTAQKGAGVSALFIQALNEGIDEAVKKGESGLKGALRYSKTAEGIFLKFLKQPNISFEDFQNKFLEAVKDKEKLDKELDELNAFADAYEKILERFNKAASGKDAGAGGAKKVSPILNEYQKLVKVIKELEEEIKNLYEEEGKLNKTAIVIAETQLGIQKEKLKALELELSARKKMDMISPKPLVGKTTEVKPMAQKYVDTSLPTNAIFTGEGLGKSISELDTLTVSLRDVGGELRSINPAMADTVINLSNFTTGVQNILSGVGGDPVSAIMGVVQVYSSVMDIITESKTQEQIRNEANLQLEDTIERINIKLTEQLTLVKGLKEGTEEFNLEYAKGQIQSLEQDIINLKEELNFTKGDKIPGQEIGRVMREIFTLGKADTEKFEDTIKRYEELIIQTEDEIKNLTETLPQLQEDLQNSLAMGITEADISSRIRSAFADGVGTVEEFGDITKGILQDAFIESIFSQEVIKNYMSKAQDSLISALDDGVLTGDEKGNLNKITEGLRVQLNSMFEGLNELDLFASETKESLAGQIKQSITEDTASMIEGLLRNIVVNISVNGQVIEGISSHIAEIAENTQANKEYLPLLVSINSKLSNVDSLSRGSGI